MEERTPAPEVVMGSKRPLEHICIPNDHHDDDRHRQDVGAAQLVAEVQQSLTTKQRLAVLRRIRQELLSDDDDNNAAVDAVVTRIDEFIAAGGIRVLVQQWGLVLDRPDTSIAHELHGVVACVDALVRRSSSSSSCRRRETVLDTLDASLLERSWSDWKCPAVPHLVHWISACTTGTHLLITQWPGLVRRLIPSLDDSSSGVAAELLGCFKNITYFDRQGRLLGEPGFVTQLTNLSINTTTIPNSNAERISAIWRNLALLYDCRSRLKHQVDMCHVLYTLATSADDDNTNPAVYRNVLSAMMNLSMDQDVCIAFLLYGDGLYPTLLRRWLTQSSDATTRKRAARTLCVWAGHGTSAHLLLAADLVGAVSTTAVRDAVADVRREAAEAFGRLASWVESPMPAHEAVLRALRELVQTASASVVARTLRGQAALPNNRALLMDCPGLIQALVTIAADADQASLLAREDACTALSHLTSVPEHRSKLVSQPLLDALCLNLPTVPAAAQIVVHLAAAETDASTLRLLLRHEPLLKVLIRCAGHASHPWKEELKRIVLQMVQAL